MKLSPTALLDMSSEFQNAADEMKTNLDRGLPELAETRWDGIAVLLDEAARLYGWAYFLAAGIEPEISSRLEQITKRAADRLAEFNEEDVQ